MRIGIPIWEEKISPVLDTALRLLIIEVEHQSESSRSIAYLDDQDLMQRCLRIKGLDVDIIICCAISHPFLRMLNASGIDVIQEISGQVEDVLEAYLHGDLFNSRFMSPWCERNRYRFEKGIKNHIEPKEKN